MNILLFIVAIITGSFNSKLKKNELLLKKKEKKLKDLYNTARIINEEKNLSDIFDKMSLYLKDSFNLKIKLYKLDKDNTVKNNEFIGSKINEIFNSHSPNYNFEKFYIFDKIIILPMLNKNVIKGIMVIDSNYKKNVDYISDILQDIATQIANKIEHIELLNLKNQLDLARESEKIYRVVLDSISHELRTPITSISTSASALCDKNIVKNEEVSEILVGDIVEASERLNRIIGNLLETIKFESGRLKLNFEKNYITELIGTVSNKFKKNCTTHHLNIHIENNLPLIYFDFVLIEQVIYNLIYNAQLYTDNGSSIYIKAFKNKNFVTIHVEDNGNGIDEIDIDKLFNKFYRGHKSKTGGTGLGLSICKSIIELHNGTISCENRVEGGARFIINLPIDRI
jgi:two-component system sensor histidine kinase KdpD